MSQEPKPNPNPQGQPTNPNPATTNAIVPEGNWVPGGLNTAVVKPVQNPNQADDNFPFSSGHKMHEVAQYQNLFTYPLDTYYNVTDAINYFADEHNRNRYTYEQQQIIISRIVRAAHDFGMEIEDVTSKLKL
jgi:hypothetical protein